MKYSSDELIYSPEAAATRFLFFQGLNEINLFVEDADMEYIYETIFKRLLGEDYNIKAIFPLGGKPKVKERFLEFGESTNGISNYYIVDGDFDRYINQDNMIDSPCFIYLETYNIENYFLDEDACIQFIKGYIKRMDAEVKKKLNFSYWKNRIVDEASKLFLCYCFIQKYYPSIKTLSRSPYLFLDDKTGFERIDGAYEQYWNNEIIALDKNAKNKIQEIDDIYKNINGLNYYNLICGKFLLDSLYCYIRSIIKKKYNKEDFKWHLINHFDISSLDYIKNIILNSE